MASSRDAPSVVDAPVGPKRDRPPWPGALWPAPAIKDGAPYGDDGGVVAVVDAPDAACAVGPGPGAAAAAAEAAVPSVPRKRGRPPLNGII
jgi:hypothetical protein